MTSDLLEENQDLRKQVEELKNENKKLNDFINAPHTKGRKTTRGDYIKSVWDLSKKLAEAKEIIKKMSDVYKYVIQYKEYANREILAEAEQFLQER